MDALWLTNDSTLMVISEATYTVYLSVCA